ncbi:MAG: twin-arginine translocation signal domain-containing protein [Acidimicrobiia bacterium]|nr:twin-arginine translocation signal domain-containing protein [Acidimicrobiia bacterium]
MSDLHVAIGRRRFLGGAATLTGGLVVGSSLALGPDVAEAASQDYLTGWNLYTSQAASPNVLSAIGTHKPTAVRWLVEWDLLHTQDMGGSYVPDPPRWEEYRPFFEALLPSEENPAGTKLYVQILAKDALWEGSGPSYLGQIPGTKWCKAGSFTNFPADIEASYLPFARSLKAILDEYGIDPVWGAWNEADMRFKWNGWTMARTPNSVEPWTCRLNDWAFWSGGAGDLWRDLHAVHGTAATYNSSQIVNETFITPTMAIPQVKEISLARYYAGEKLANGVLTFFESMLPTFDAATPGETLPFFVTECGVDSDSIYATLSTENAARLWQRHNLATIADKTPGNPLYGRYLGMASHMRPNFTDASDPNWRWWEYRPEYEQYLDDEEPVPGAPSPTPEPKPRTRPRSQSQSMWQVVWGLIVGIVMFFAKALGVV